MDFMKTQDEQDAFVQDINSLCESIRGRAEDVERANGIELTPDSRGAIATALGFVKIEAERLSAACDAFSVAHPEVDMEMSTTEA